MKEYRVYIVDAGGISSNNISAYEIENWGSYEDIHGKLTTEAEKFISLAKNIGKVYSLRGFTEDANLNEIDLSNCYVYITNNY